MTTAVRVVQGDCPQTLKLHLRRLGLAEAEVERLGRERASWQLLVTGLSREEARALREAEAVSPVQGDPDRAAGTALVSGRRDQIDLWLRELSAKGLAELSGAIEAAIGRQHQHPEPTTIGRRRFDWGSRTYLMGVINVTPDSFSDGGKHATADTAVAAGERLAAEGVDLIDIGGESTRPGAQPVPESQEIDRVLPVLERLARTVEVPLSVDTTKAKVAQAAARAGASMVNDISALTYDPEMAPTCAREKLAVCAMHIRGEPRNMQVNPSYLDLMGEILEGLAASLALAERCGIAADRLLVDPGVGFGKTAEHNLFILDNLGQLKALGRPILVGASRKSFIGKITGKAVGERLPGSLAVLAAAVLGGADVVRVHDVAESKVAAQVVDAIARAREGGLSFTAVTP
jgi:dihydropteroate synthase